MDVSVAVPGTSFLQSLGRFGLHFAEMCGVMCLGGIAIDFAVFQAAAAVGYDLAGTYPAVALAVIGIVWAVAMTVWMRARGHAWSHTLEMSATAIAVAGLFAVATGLGWIQTATPLGWVSLYFAVCGPACLVMALDMALRFKHYSGVGGHSHAMS